VVVEQLRRPVPGGVGTYARGLLAGLARLGPEGPEVALHASRPTSSPDPLRAFGLPLRLRPLPGRALTGLWERGLLPAPAGYDVVHSTSMAFPPPRGPATVMIHDLTWRAVPEAFPARGRRWHEAALGRAIRTGVGLVAPSQATAAALAAAGAGPVTVIEEGCDHLPPPDQAGADALLARLGVDGPFFLSVGTQEPRKNLARLFEAFGRARPRLPGPWPLVVVGPSGWGPELTAGPGVLAAGAVSDAVLAALYRRARALAYVPLVEGFGLPPVEAMHAGLPVVASPMPSTGGAALEVDPLDVEGIARALEEVAGDDARHAALADAGARRAAGLTWEGAARRHVELWRSRC